MIISSALNHSSREEQQWFWLICTGHKTAVHSRTALSRLRLEAGRGFVVIVTGVGLSGTASLLFAKMLSTEQFGVYIFAITLVNYLVLIARGGMSNSAIRYVNQYLGEDPNLLRGFVQWAKLSLVKINVVLLVVASFLVLVAATFRPMHELGAYVVAIIGMAPLSFVFLHAALLRAEKRIVPSQLPLSVFRPLLALLLAGLVWRSGQASGTAFALAEVLGIAAMVYPLSRMTRHLWEGENEYLVPSHYRQEWRRTTLGITFAELSQQLIGQADILLVGWYFGMAEAGIYGIATRLAKLVVLGNRAANSIAGPMIAEAYHGGDFKTLQAVVSQTCTLSIGATALMSVLLAFVPESLFAWLGEGFDASRTILFILLVGQCVNATTGPVGVVLILTGHQSDQTIINLTFGLFLAGGIYLTSRLGGTVSDVAILFSAALAMANITKGVLVYLRTGIKSWPNMRL